MNYKIVDYNNCSSLSTTKALILSAFLLSFQISFRMLKTLHSQRQNIVITSSILCFHIVKT